MDAYRLVEGQLRDIAERKGGADAAGSREIDMRTLIDTAGARGWLSREAVRFLHSCRRARNAFTHVHIDGYEGPVALPPRAVVHQLERLGQALRNPPKASAVAPMAVTCDPNDPIALVLTIMHAQDFSQVPYRDEFGVWNLVTHLTISRWVAREADDGSASLLDLTTTVREVADKAHLHCQAVVRPTGALVSELIEDLEAAVRLSDDAVGGYAAVLVDSGKGAVRIFTPDDLPRAYSLLGR